ncbi:CoA-transferase family III domain-containing protein [Pseudomassariella vexata]|uniref:CoA-transferase family III domain-containing protein n=1 Tax=Pseudomassariella vexata TaxID=1141098 RepID=A0A1Y2EHZ1_9PEZI|nr:CoA-transferase family III domain-containing protein [Pseudomassariella vexata]ORY71183.1 CoA-transferase family III domain-containing protein [Pseudomassariella vexata]
MVGPPPLQGIKVLEFAGLAPGPFAGLLLSDAGANVLRIDRAIPGRTHTPGVKVNPTEDLLTRRKSSIVVDLKSPRGIALIKDLAKTTDVIIDPFRPGVLERLGLGPDVLTAINPRLIYGRMTGFRRDGKYAAMAGHDINYLAVSGVLSLLGRSGEKPHPPWNILADFAGGGATLFQGILLAMIARQKTQRGQVVEANMVDGASYLTTFPRQTLKTPLGSEPRGENILDGGCPYYDTYETKDGKYMSVGALEPQFYTILVQGLGLGDQGWEKKRYDRTNWPEMRQQFETAFKAKTRSEWERVFDGTDACCAPVLEYAELETVAGREGDQRPPVTLRENPMLAVSQNVTNPSAQGQGNGYSGNGYQGHPLYPGEGGEAALTEWFGLTKGREFDVEEGGLVLKQKSKL